jgi:hypothetical protein
MAYIRKMGAGDGLVHHYPFSYRGVGFISFPYLGSDIIHAELFGIHLVVLNSEKAATDLLDKRSSIYSDRCGCTPLAARLIP